ncbi:MAG: hypothetical protein C0P74_007945 [Gammaproteobacteria bacterium]|nr:hypothetical protein [Gammaproteobacteria bacterium]
MSLLSLILIVTVGAPDIEAMQRAYSEWLDYTVESRGHVSQELAEAWNAPKMAGRAFVLMQPKSKEPVYLRFVQVDALDGYVPMKTYGWNAIEILVQDPDGLAAKFERPGSPFKVVGPPRPLGPNSPIRAMQAVGPANEVLYLTRVPPDFRGGPAKTPVDRPFIMIVGGPDQQAVRNFYKDLFGVETSDPVMARITVLNKAHGLDVETTHPISLARLSDRFSIEIDRYPPTATEREVRPGEIPSAISIVSVVVPSLDDLKVPTLTPARKITEKPYAGRRVAVIRGAAGELIELVEE